MANVQKKDGGQPQATQQNPQGQPQRGELVRREAGQQLTRDPFQMFFRDPFQLMRELMVDPFRMFSQMPSAGRAMGRMPQQLNPSFDIRETDDAFVFKADMPGIKAEDLDITLQGNQLEISGKRDEEREEGEGQYYTYERSYGSFCRSFSLPESADLDNVRTDLKNGELTLVVPKRPGTSPQKKKIQIGSGAKQ